jgi:ribonuclease HI
VVSDFSLADILHNQDTTRHISKWAVELGALTLDFKPRIAIKSQALVDFMAEWRENQVEAPTNQPEHWVMYFDGSLKLGGGGPRVLFISPRGEQLKYMFQILFEVSNNEAEYEALLHGLCLAISLGIKRLLIYGDSFLVVQQVNKDTMDAYVMEIRKLENKFSGLEIHHVISNNNVGAAVLSKLGFDRANVPQGVFIHELHHPYIRALDSSSITQGPKELDREVLMIELDWGSPSLTTSRSTNYPLASTQKALKLLSSYGAAKGMF